MTILPFDNSHAGQIARLHQTEIKTGFLSIIGIPFLTNLYKAISCATSSAVFVAFVRSDGADLPEEKNPVGFIAGTLNTREMYKYVILNHWQHLLLHLAVRAFSLKSIKFMLETVRYGLSAHSRSSSASTSSPCAELLSIAVRDDMRGKGIGKSLISHLERYFIQNQQAAGKNTQEPFRYKAVTVACDSVANSFYISAGFVLTRQFIHHGNLMNEYIKTLSVSSLS